jgi:regulator of vacuolar morphogenesis
MAQLACMDMDTVLALLGVLTRLLSEVVRGGNTGNVKRLGAWAWGLLGRCRDIGELGSGEVGEIRDLGKRASKVLAKIRETQREIQDYQSQGQEGEDEDEEPYEPDDGDAETVVDLDGGNGAPLTGNTVVSAEVSTLDIADETTNLNGGDFQEDLEAAKLRLQEKLLGDIPPVTDPAGISAEEGEVEEEDQDEIVEDPNETRKQSRAMLDMIITIVGEFYGQRDLLESRDLWDEDLEDW